MILKYSDIRYIRGVHSFHRALCISLKRKWGLSNDILEITYSLHDTEKFRRANALIILD